MVLRALIDAKQCAYWPVPINVVVIPQSQVHQLVGSGEYVFCVAEVKSPADLISPPKDECIWTTGTAIGATRKE
jgi:hypothetical protein